MPDVVGWRAKFGVIVPSTNTVVEHDFINAATLWHALRANGIRDRFAGFGSLLREH